MRQSLEGLGVSSCALGCLGGVCTTCSEILPWVPVGLTQAPQLGGEKRDGFCILSFPLIIMENSGVSGIWLHIQRGFKIGSESHTT